MGELSTRTAVVTPKDMPPPTAAAWGKLGGLTARARSRRLLMRELGGREMPRFARLDARGNGVDGAVSALVSRSSVGAARRASLNLAQAHRMSEKLSGAIHEGGFSCFVAWSSAF